MPRQFGIECLFAGLPSFVECAGLAQPHRQFRAGVRGRFRAPQIAHCLEGGDCIDPCLSRLIGKCKCVVHGIELSLPEACISNGHALFARGGIEDVRPDQPFDRPVGTELRRTDSQDAN